MIESLKNYEYSLKEKELNIKLCSLEEKLKQLELKLGSGELQNNTGNNQSISSSNYAATASQNNCTTKHDSIYTSANCASTDIYSSCTTSGNSYIQSSFIPNTYNNVNTHNQNTEFFVPSISQHYNPHNRNYYNQLSDNHNTHNRFSIPYITPNTHTIPSVQTSCNLQHSTSNINYTPRQNYDYQQNINYKTNFNPYCNVNDVISILPEFNPLSKESLDSKKFISKLNHMKMIYGWNDNILIFAVQSKLKGPAKQWIDSIPYIFEKWDDFCIKFLNDFPTIALEDDIHMTMIETKRLYNENVIDYYYKMLSLGRKGNLKERIIIKYILNGINENEMKKNLITNEYEHCNDLLCAIQRYVNYNYTKKPIVQQQKNRVENNFKNESKSDNGKKTIACYNCSKTGHISINCPEPQKKKRCLICQRTTHETSKCPEKYKNSNNTNQKDISAIQIKKPYTGNDEIIKEVKFNDSTYRVFIDPGSEKSLIRELAARKFPILKSDTVILNGFGGSKYYCNNKIIGVIEFDNIKQNCELLVVKDEHLKEDILLGRDILCKKGNRVIIEEDNCRIENKDNVINNKNLDSDDLNKLNELLTKYKNCFAANTNELGKCTLLKMKIELNNNEPINMKPYRIPLAKRPIVENIVSDLLKNEIIRHSDSPYAFPVVLAEKKNHEHRMCIDYRRLNKITVKRPYPMPNLEEQISLLAGYKIFTNLDLMMGYHQIEMDETSKQLTAFVTHEGHYEFNRMPFGLVNAPSVFQDTMNEIAKQFKDGRIIVYFDDVVIPSETIDEGVRKLELFLEILQKHNLKLRYKKCKFLSDEITFLGHEINGNGISPSKTKLSAIQNFKEPGNITEVRRFLGLTGFFRKFVREYSLISKPLTELLKKSNAEKFYWKENQKYAFNKLIKILCSEPVLVIYNQHEYHEVHTDASSVGIAGVLLQSKDGKSAWHPVFYYSRHCNESESKLHSSELELLAVVETLERFRIYLLGKHFKIVTDCSAITTLKDTTEVKPRIARLWFKLLEYDYELVHRKGQQMTHVDALSRMPDLPPKEIDHEAFVIRIKIQNNNWLLSMQLQDKSLVDIIAALKGELENPQIKQLKTDYVLQNDHLYRKIGNKLTFVVPKAVRWRVTQFYHDGCGHFGIEKTIERIQSKFWFPRMRKYVKEYISSCIECCYQKNKSGMTEGRLHFDDPIPIPFNQLHIDHLGPFTRTKRGNIYILTISDSFSKYLIAKAVKNTKTTHVLNILNELTTYFGLPKIIVTDRGTSFTSKQFESFCQQNHIKHIKVAVRTPRANGQAERANQTILTYLRTSADPKTWDENLRELQWLMNSQKNSTTKFSPNELIFDFKLNDIMTNHLIAALQEETEVPECNIIDIKQKRNLAVENINRERLRWKSNYDKKHAVPTTYNKGDLVLVENEPASTGESRKLEPKYKGPYKIINCLPNDRYVIETINGMAETKRKFSSVFSSEKLKPFCKLYPDLDGICDEQPDDRIEDDS